MLTIDDSRWSIVSAHFQGTKTPEEMAQFYNRFEKWLTRQEQFCLILRRDAAQGAEERGKRSPEVTTGSGVWLTFTNFSKCSLGAGLQETTVGQKCSPYCTLISK